MFDAAWPVKVVVHAGGMPLPGRVEVCDCHDAAQVTAAVGVAARLAVPVMLPLRPVQVLPPVGIDGRKGLRKPVRLSAAVYAEKCQCVAADVAHKIV